RSAAIPAPRQTRPELTGSSAALTLLQVILDAFGLAHQEGDVLVRGLDEVSQHLHGVGELLGEFLVLLIAPGVAKAGELSLQHGGLVAQVVAEVFEPVREATQLRRIDNGLRHKAPRKELFPPHQFTVASPPGTVNYFRCFGCSAPLY